MHPPEELDDEELLEDGDTQAGDRTKQLPIPLIGQHVIFPEVHPLTTVPAGQFAARPDVQQEPLEELLEEELVGGQG